MYSPDIVEKRLFQAKKAGLKFQRLPRDKSIEIASKLERLMRGVDGQVLDQPIRPLDEREREFIVSERILCKADFEYYLSRYHVVERDPGVGGDGGTGPATLLPSQRVFIKRLGQREDSCYAELKKYGHTAGILVYAHKCRQVVFTSTARAAAIHRMVLYPGTRAFAATLKDGPEGKGELYKRDKISVDGLPFWMKPSITPDVKDTEVGFEFEGLAAKSRLTYAAENQQNGIGTGTQQDISHLTEVPLWNYPGRIRYSFIPAIPKAISTLHIQEGTSAGKGGYWQEVSEGCRNKLSGFEDYIYIFVGWYVNVLKYRGNPPDDWSPNEHTVKHAELIERTSPEFCDGVAHHPTRDQLYWWEKTRELHMRNGELSSFLANYPATPEQSFVNAAEGALPIELLEKMEMNIRPPHVYEVRTVA